MSVQNNSLRRIYEGLKDDHTFKSLEDFIEWSVKHGHKTRLTLYKLDTAKPHGPENSYWYQDNKPLPDIENPFCKGCDRPCPGSGCLNYRKNFIIEWNRNICRRPKEIVPDTERVFCYEHPDLVREGIVFGAN